MKPKTTLKICKKHGNTTFTLESSKFYRCLKCRSENVSKRRKALKEKLVSQFGGKCNKCGYDKCLAALEFHHLDHQEKKFGISYKGLTRSFKRLLEESKKCILLCSNCHKELEYNQTTL